MEMPSQTPPDAEYLDADLDAVLVLLSGFPFPVASALQNILERQAQAREDEIKLRYGVEDLRRQRQTVNNLHRKFERAHDLLDFFQRAILVSPVVDAPLIPPGLGGVALSDDGGRLYLR